MTILKALDFGVAGWQFGYVRDSLQRFRHSMIAFGSDWPRRSIHSRIVNIATIDFKTEDTKGNVREAEFSNNAVNPGVDEGTSNVSQLLVEFDNTGRIVSRSYQDSRGYGVQDS